MAKSISDSLEPVFNITQNNFSKLYSASVNIYHRKCVILKAKVQVETIIPWQWVLRPKSYSKDIQRSRRYSQRVPGTNPFVGRNLPFKSEKGNNSLIPLTSILQPWRKIHPSKIQCFFQILILHWMTIAKKQTNKKMQTLLVGWIAQHICIYRNKIIKLILDLQLCALQ